ncbi:MAG TPA: hypothetical protein VNN72_28530 [Polyangiaceae bacterium]|nr:hypothetical protein [Polyangiaceae bacterium]
MANADERGASTRRFEVWGILLALAVFVAFGVTFGLTLVPRAAPSENADDGPGDPRATYQAEQSVEAWHAGRWYPAHVHSTSGNRYFITYDDFSISWHEWVTARRLRRH